MRTGVWIRRSQVRLSLPPERSLADGKLHRACPIFLVSNVSGESLPLLKTFLNVVPTGGVEGRYPVDDDFELSISDVFSVPFVGSSFVPSSLIAFLKLTHNRRHRRLGRHPLRARPFVQISGNARTYDRPRSSVSVGDTVLLGPDSLGAFVPTAIKSIQRKRVNVHHAEAGQSVSFALKRIKRAAVRKGAILAAVDPSSYNC